MSAFRKIKVANGVYWLEIPEAQLYVLCGCPADSVKFLMKRGLIVTGERNGIAFETGPNAILLSDILVQNGSFANLAEFPVLQMLYRQGMLLPNHPNNTGAKPLLIGSKDQVQAQMEYIFRGNYGLVSKEEIMDAGQSAEKAQEMMRLKRAFGFGEIRQTEALLDTRIVESEPVEIKNEVFVRRLRLNVFEFQYRGESVTVDLNLALHDRYGAPYSLGFHHIPRGYFTIIHSGEGDGFDSSRPCTSSILMFQGKIYLIDIGPNFSNILMALGISVNEIEGIFHTHGHDDHFADLPTLMRADHRIKYYATPLVRASVTKKLSALLSIEGENFSDYFETHDLEFDVWNDIDGLEVKPIFSPHPVETSIFVFRTLWNEGYYSYGHFADIAAFDVLQRMTTERSSECGISQEFFDKVKKNYLQKLHLKKIDIGGGMIHGSAEDFREDPSEKIILSHTALELTDQQKEIGSGAPFGTFDIVIPAHQKYPWQYAYQFLHSYFPSAPPHQLRVLLNNPVVTFNPESIILKGKSAHNEIYLILTGNVEMIQSESGIHNLLSAGALVGETSGLTGAPSMATYRAVSYVQALRLPCNLYLEFVKRNGLYADIKNLQDKREFLQTTWLLGESISYPIQTRVAQAMSYYRYDAGKEISMEKNAEIFLIKHGSMQRYLDQDVFETLGAGHFFGEEGVLFEMPGLFRFRTTEPTDVYNIPGEVLLAIPLVRWKLFETFKRRKGSILDSDLVGTPVFTWREVYSVNIQEMDEHHRQIFERANKLHAAIDSAEEAGEVEEALDFLVQYAEFHFTEEESLLERHHYPEYEPHRAKHQGLIKDVLRLRAQRQKEGTELGTDVLGLLKSWIIDHILTEDRRYGQFLNERGVS